MDVLLFSGGIESTCLAYMRQPDVCLTIDYGQIVAAGEIGAAEKISAHLGLNHQTLSVDLSSLGSGQLAGTRAIKQSKIPELWPFRNQMLVTLAAMKFAGSEPLRIIIGTVKGDQNHGDGTDKFVQSIDAALRLQEGNAQLVAPAIHLESLDLLLASNIDVDLLDMTFSCFQAQIPCGRCRGCEKNETLRASYFDLRPSCH